MLEIKQLISANCHLTQDEQTQICGGESSEGLWSGYANGEYNIGNNGTNSHRYGEDTIKFTKTYSYDSGDKVVTIGAADSTTGKSVYRKPLDD